MYCNVYNKCKKVKEKLKCHIFFKENFSIVYSKCGHE